MGTAWTRQSESDLIRVRTAASTFLGLIHLIFILPSRVYFTDVLQHCGTVVRGATRGQMPYLKCGTSTSASKFYTTMKMVKLLRIVDQFLYRYCRGYYSCYLHRMSTFNLDAQKPMYYSRTLY